MHARLLSHRVCTLRENRKNREKSGKWKMVREIRETSGKLKRRQGKWMMDCACAAVLVRMHRFMGGRGHGTYIYLPPSLLLELRFCFLSLMTDQICSHLNHKRKRTCNYIRYGKVAPYTQWRKSRWWRGAAAGHRGGSSWGGARGWGASLL